MAIKDLAELIKKFTQKDKFKPTTVQVIRAAKNPPVPAQNEDISVPSEGERIHFLNTGRSDCILLQSGDRFALVDCGDAEHAKHTAQYLKETAGGKINLDFVAITHLHSGHVGGLETLLDDGDITIGKIYLKPFISPNLAQWDKCLHDGDALYKSLSEKAQSMNIPVIGYGLRADFMNRGGAVCAWQLGSAFLQHRARLISQEHRRKRQLARHTRRAERQAYSFGGRHGKRHGRPRETRERRRTH